MPTLASAWAQGGAGREEASESPPAPTCAGLRGPLLASSLPAPPCAHLASLGGSGACCWPWRLVLPDGISNGCAGGGERVSDPRAATARTEIHLPALGSPRSASTARPRQPAGCSRGCQYDARRQHQVSRDGVCPARLPRCWCPRSAPAHAQHAAVLSARPQSGETVHLQHTVSCFSRGGAGEVPHVTPARPLAARFVFHVSAPS